jgi:hypothetical protein
MDLQKKDFLYLLYLLYLQLAPWSTPQLRQRLQEVFGVTTDPETVGRDGVKDNILFRR